MKIHLVTLAVIAIAVLFSTGQTAAIAQPFDSSMPQLTEQKLKIIEENLVVALAYDDIPDLQASAALVLRDVKRIAPDFSFNRSVIPLMHIVKNERFDRTRRIAAALALYELDSNIGDFAIRRTGEFTEDTQIRHICQSMMLQRTRMHLIDEDMHK